MNGRGPPSSLFAIGRGRHARQAAEELAEETVVGKVEFGGDLADGFRAVAQEDLRTGDHGRVYPMLGGVPALLLNEAAEIARREAEAVGVVGGGARLVAVGIDQGDKLIEQIGTAEMVRIEIVLEHVQVVVVFDDGSKQGMEDALGIGFLMNKLPDGAEHLLQKFAVARCGRSHEGGGGIAEDG